MRGFGWKKLPGKPHKLALVAIRKWADRRYFPNQDYPGLFRTFSILSTLKGKKISDGILEFANKYGTLGIAFDIDNQHLDEFEDPPDVEDAEETTAEWEREYGRNFRYGDTFANWAKEIRAMAGAVAALDRLRADDASENLDLQIANWTNEAFDRTEVRIRLARIEDTDRLALHCLPKNLIGLMWAQLAMAATGRKDFRQCLYCGRWLEESAERGRANQVYCDEACRMGAYRRRKSDAIRLAAEGLLEKEIADRLLVRTKSVRAWLQAAREQGEITDSPKRGRKE